MVVKGSCQCGAVKYTASGRPKIVVACHCLECQKLSTGPFSVTAIYDAKSISFQGRMGEWSRVADSGNCNVAKFCLSCGNRICQYNPDQMEIVKLKLKPVDRELAAFFEPSVHIWTSQKVPWYVIPEGVEVFDANRV